MPNIKLDALPGEDAPDYFRALVRNCITTFEHIPNNTLALDYNGVSGKLRALILDDAEYTRETRNIYARQRLEEIQELSQISQLSAQEESAEGEYDDPRRKTRRSGKKESVTANRDVLTLRFKAMQMKRELLTNLSTDSGDLERDAVNIMFVPITTQEYERLAEIEIHRGNADENFEELTGTKEELPTGSAWTAQDSDGEPRPEDFFDVDPDTGEVVEKG